MPISIILLLAARGELPKDQLGREAQGWFLKQVQAIDHALSADLHRPNEGKAEALEAEANQANLREGKWQAEWDGHCAMLHTLAQFAFYCRCGHHTTIGLGQNNPVLETR